MASLTDAAKAALSKTYESEAATVQAMKYAGLWGDKTGWFVSAATKPFIV